MARAARFDFTDQVVVVTGGSNGIGLAIARAFADAGAAVTITGTAAGAGDYAHDLSAFSYQQLLVEDAAAVARVIGGLERIDILVNCAGVALREREYDDDGFQQVIAVNLLGSQRTAYAALPQLRASHGVILNIASMTSYFGFTRVPAYSASKTAIVSLTKSLAAAWAQHGIRVNAVAPGWVVTNMTEKARANEQLATAIVERTPMDRWAQPDEMAGMALFLCSDAAGFVTGVTVPVDGGFSASLF